MLNLNQKKYVKETAANPMRKLCLDASLLGLQLLGLPGVGLVATDPSVNSINKLISSIKLQRKLNH